MSRPLFLSECPKGAGFISAFCVAALGLAALPALAQSTPGSVADPNLFSGKTVTSSTTFDPNQFGPANAVDGDASVFAFADDQTPGTDIFTISGISAPAGINTLRFFDSGAFTHRASPSVTITASNGTTSTNLGLFTLPTTGQFDYYTTASSDTPGYTIHYDTLSNLLIPAGTTSVQFSFARGQGDGPAFAEIQGFNIPAAAPEPSQAVAFCVGLLGLGALALKARRRDLPA